MSELMEKKNHQPFLDGWRGIMEQLKPLLINAAISQAINEAVRAGPH